MELPDLSVLKQTNVIDAPPLLKAGESELDALNILRGALGVVVGEHVLISTPVETVIIADWTLTHIVEKRDAQRERYANFILPTLINPLEVWRVEYEDGSIRNRYIKLFTGKKDVYVIVRVNEDGSLLWNFIPTRIGTVQSQREGTLLMKSY